MTRAVDEKLYGQGLLGPMTPQVDGALRQEFLLPPFTVLSARDGAWQDRKRAWLSLGIEGEIGRDTNLLKFSDMAQAEKDSTSIFDPVLCEVAYRWWCPQGGVVVDPFAGGSVRGIVAATMGLRYWGCDLSSNQISANKIQQDRINPKPKPIWRTGDALDCLPDAPQADFIFTCPPYGSLEKYSDDPADLSAMDVKGFRKAYAQIIATAVDRLRDNRFACFVVGDYRDKAGHYCNLPGVTVRAFERVGMHLYNEAVLCVAITSASMRARRIFSSGRKLCKTHQNVLVFVKGDAREAAIACGAKKSEK